MAFHTWDLHTAVLHSQTSSSLLEAGGGNFRVEDTPQSVWGAEDRKQAWRQLVVSPN